MSGNIKLATILDMVELENSSLCFFCYLIIIFKMNCDLIRVFTMISRCLSLNLTPVVFRQMLKLSDAPILRSYTRKYVWKFVFIFVRSKVKGEKGLSIHLVCKIQSCLMLCLQEDSNLHHVSR